MVRAPVWGTPVAVSSRPSRLSARGGAPRRDPQVPPSNQDKRRTPHVERGPEPLTRFPPPSHPAVQAPAGSPEGSLATRPVGLNRDDLRAPLRETCPLPPLDFAPGAPSRDRARKTGQLGVRRADATEPLRLARLSMGGLMSAATGGDELTERVLSAFQAVREGAPIKRACYLAGISTAAFYRWRKLFGDADRDSAIVLLREHRELCLSRRRLSQLEIRVDLLRRVVAWCRARFPARPLASSETMPEDDSWAELLRWSRRTRASLGRRSRTSSAGGRPACRPR